MCRSVEIATPFAVPLRRTDGHSKKRRYEEAKLPMRSAAAGLWPAYRKSKNGKYKQLAILCCLYLPFFDFLTREARGGGCVVGVRLARWRQPACLSWALLRFFASSVLRGEPLVRVSATVRGVDRSG